MSRRKRTINEILFKQPIRLGSKIEFAYWMRVNDLIVGFDSEELVKQLLMKYKEKDSEK